MFPAAFEEIGLPIDTTRIRYLTTLPPFLARSMMLVTPVVCLNLDYSLRVRFDTASGCLRPCRLTFPNRSLN